MILSQKRTKIPPLFWCKLFDHRWKYEASIEGDQDWWIWRYVCLCCGKRIISPELLDYFGNKDE